MYRVDDEDNMLLMSMTKLQSFSKSNNPRDLCICRKGSSGTAGFIQDIITCTDNKPELIACNAQKNLIPVQKDTCYERHNRKRRSLRHSFTYIPNNLVLPKRAKTIIRKVRILNKNFETF